MEAAIDLSSFTIEDLLEEYKNLHERHQQLKERSEEDAQRIYELKRSLDTATAGEAYLAQELEQLNLQSTGVGRGSDSKIQQELDELKRNHKQLLSDYETLQQEYEVKTDEATKLREKLEEVTRKFESSTTLPADTHVDCVQRQASLEAENLELLQKLEEFGDNNVQHTFMVAEKDKTIEILRDQVGCLEENLRCKRDELEEKLQMIESAQDQLVEANARIAALSSAPEKERKGNSLFAEVDDQRQVMKQLLAAQKTSYMQMKKSFSESEYEIRRLKRENMAMHIELQTCSKIFCSADKIYQDKLNERIRQLINQNETLERKLSWTQERLKDLAGEKSVLWLDSMLNFCKQETDELKKQLHSVRIQKASLEEQLRNVQQDLARWRFESLKSRCVLIDRENLLMEHKISFKPNNALEFDIKEAQLKAARPRIVTVQQQQQPESHATAIKQVEEQQIVKLEAETSKVTAPSTVDDKKEEPKVNISPATVLRVKTPTELNNIENTGPQVKLTMENGVEPSVAIKKELEIKPEIEIKAEKVDTDQIIVIEDTPIKSKLIARPPTPPKNNNSRSILAKKRDVLDEDEKKHVQFSSSQPIVHNFSPLNSDTGDEETKENKPDIVKYVRPKSKVIVKRIIVGQKQKQNK